MTYGNEFLDELHSGWLLVAAELYSQRVDFILCACNVGVQLGLDGLGMGEGSLCE